MEFLEKRRNQLLETYAQYRSELQEKCPQLVKEGYSHPYYLHIPEQWFARKYRVLIVGEEGYGVTAHDVSIADAQTFNKEYMESQLGASSVYQRNNSPFWNRIRKIHALFGAENVSITWTNIDKIQKSGIGSCQLRAQDRNILHKTPTRILTEEIKLLIPTHVIYFGWYGISLKGELPEVFQALYPGGLRDYSKWKDCKLVPIEQENIQHIFTYHPSWGQRQKNYEQRVLDAIQETLQQTERQSI